LQIALMKKLYLFSVLVAVLALAQSCLVPGAPHKHYFVPVKRELPLASYPEIMIFSTPRSKSYVITNLDLKSKVTIQSPIFDSPERYYLAEDQLFFDEQAKQFVVQKRDGPFYKNGLYKTLTLKLELDGTTTIIDYQIAD